MKEEIEEGHEDAVVEIDEQIIERKRSNLTLETFEKKRNSTMDSSEPVLPLRMQCTTPKRRRSRMGSGFTTLAAIHKPVEENKNI